MKSSSPAGNELVDEVTALAMACLSGDADGEEAARLDELLCSSDEACRIYVRVVSDSSSLRRWSAAERPSSEERLDPQTLLALAGASLDNVDHGGQDLSPERGPYPIPGFLGSATDHTTDFSSGWPAAYLAATVVLGLGLLIGLFVPVSDPQRTAAPASPPIKSMRGSEMAFVGRISGLVDCRWADPNTAVPGPVAVPLGRKYALASGLLEITYDTGAKVILQGPCTYEVDSVAGGYLSLGRLTARVEKKAEGGGRKAEEATAGREGSQQDGDHDQSQRALTLALSQGERGPSASSALRPSPSALFSVRTPTAVVTDLGTEFGVEVTGEGATEAHVFVGAITMAPPGQSGTTEQATIVRAGSAVRLDGKSNHVSAVTLNTTRFVRHVASVQSVAAQKYAEMILAMQPVAYYRMDRQAAQQTQLKDSASGGHDGQIKFDRAFLRPPRALGRYGDAVPLRGPMVRDHAIVADYPKASEEQLTVSAWIWAGAINSETWPAAVANWGRTVNGQFHLGLYSTDLDLEASIADRHGNMISAREGSPLPQQIWQHAAFTCDGKKLKLYRNSRLVDEQSCDGMLTKPPIRCLTIGCNANDTGDDGDSHFWQGRVDEVVVFNRVLSSDAIRQLYEGPPEQKPVDTQNGQPAEDNQKPKNASGA